MFSGQWHQNYIQRNAIQTGVPHLNLGILRKIPVQRPPLPEQKAIAAALSDIDDLLATLDALIAKKRDIKQAAMQQLLTGERRLPGFVDAWDTARVGDGVDLISGQHILAKYCNEDGVGVPYLTGPADYRSGKIANSKFTDRPRAMCLRGDILMTVKGSGAGMMVVSDGEYCISRQLMAIRSHSWSEKFLYFRLRHAVTEISAASAGLIPGLTRSDITNQTFLVPLSIPEQAAIATILSDMDSEITALEARRDKTHALKQGMMQELLSGRIRLL